MSSATPTAIAAALGSRLQRADLIRELKASGQKDINSWVSLVRLDLILAAAADNPDAWKQVARLADQALLGSREVWKANPEQYITITLDQARAHLRCATLADAKRTLGSLRSVSSVKQVWAFWQLLIVIEARQGDAAAAKRALETARPFHASHEQFQLFEKLLRETDGLAAIAKAVVDDYSHPALTAQPGAVSGSPPGADRPVAAEPAAAAAPAVRAVLPAAVPVPPPAVSTTRLGLARPRASIMRASFISSLSPVMERTGSGKGGQTEDDTGSTTMQPNTVTSLASSTTTGSNSTNSGTSRSTASSHHSTESDTVSDSTRGALLMTTMTACQTHTEDIAAATSTLHVSHLRAEPALPSSAATRAGASSSAVPPPTADSAASDAARATKKKPVAFALPDYIRDFKKDAAAVVPNGAKKETKATLLAATARSPEEETVQLMPRAQGNRAAALDRSVAAPGDDATVAIARGASHGASVDADGTGDDTNVIISAPRAVASVAAPPVPAKVGVAAAAPVARHQPAPVRADLNESAATDSSLDEGADDSDVDTVPFGKPVAKSSGAVLFSSSATARPPVAASSSAAAFEASSPVRHAAPGAGGSLFDSLAASSEVIRVSGKSYLRLSCIGRGGSSRVYRVMGEDLNIYALKRVRLSRMDTASVETYKNEIALMKRLAGSRHIIRLVDAEVAWAAKCIHMVMECGQTDLNSLLSQERDRVAAGGGRDDAADATTPIQIDENLLRLVWQQMLQAVHTIHEARIVHSDLKPANFVFVEGVLKLIDFGIAKAINSDTTNIVRDSQVGTVNYMSPEAIQDTSGGRGRGGYPGAAPMLKQGRPSDIWSLGCILYQMVYGRTPFADLSLIQKLHAICDPAYNIAFPAISNGPLLDVMRACLTRDPSKRPTIAGVSGLLSHPFLRPVNALPVSVPLSSEQLQQLISSVVDAALSFTGTSRHESQHVTAVSSAIVEAIHEGRVAFDAAAIKELLRELVPAPPASPVVQLAARPPAAANVFAAAAAAASSRATPAPKVETAVTSAPASAASAAQAVLAPRAVSGNVLHRAITEKAAALRPVDKENMPAAKRASSDAPLVAALKKGLQDRFSKAKQEEIEDTVEMTWQSTVH